MNEEIHINDKPMKQFIIVKSIVLNDKGEVLFVRRKREWHAEAHDKWELPGGKIDFGEAPEETAVRETKEESGYASEVIALIPRIFSSKWEYHDRISQQILICYVCKLLGGSSSLNDNGVSEVKWFKLSHVPKKEDCLPCTIEFIDEYLKR